jgi:Phage tail lysozyme
MAAIPANAKAIYAFLRAEGFTLNAASGILGNIEQESGGNPAESGGGLIQILQGNPGYTSSTSLKAQLAGVMTYIRANGSVADINAHAQSPESAALYFSGKYERPGIPDNANRTASASLVAKAAKTGDWSTSSTLTSAQGGSGNGALGLSGGLAIGSEAVPGFGSIPGIPGIQTLSGAGQTIGDIGTALQAIANDLSTMFHFVVTLWRPTLWLRIGAFFVGILALFAGAFFAGKSIGIKGPDLSKVPIPIPV